MAELKEKLCVVMPVYNEEAAIGSVLQKWDDALSALGIDYEIRPYNDGSKDNSLAVMRKVAEGRKTISVRDKPNGGHGNTILTGYREASADGFDWVFQVDSDDEMGPEKFSELWAIRGDYDFLVGKRDGRVQSLPRKIVSIISRLCVRLFYGKSIWDVNAPYRLMRVSVFKDFYGKIPMTTFAPNVILSGLAAKHKLRCFEIPVPQHDRTTGEVSIKKWKLFKAAAKSFWQTVWFAKPALPFTMMEIVVFAVCYTITILAYSCSPIINHPYTDSSVFVYVGRVMQNGGLPYVDVFDHKGPLLYILNYLGLSITGNIWGIWLEECILLLVCSIVFFHCIHGIWGRVPTVLSIIGLFMFVMGTSDGNLTESWGLCFAMIILSDMVKGLNSGSWSFKRGLFSGISIAALALLRPNLLPIGLIYVLSVMCDCFSRRGFLLLRTMFWSVAVGGCIVILPIMYWLLNAGCIEECWRSYILFNLEYLGARGFVSNWNYIFLGFVLLFSTIAWFSVRRGGNNIRSVYLWAASCALLNWAVIALRPTHSHYYEIMIPELVILIAMACHYSCGVKRVIRISTLCLIFACCGFESVCVTLRPWIDLNLAASSLLDGTLLANIRSIVGPACSRDHIAAEILSLKPYIEDLDSVTVLRNECFAYEVLNARTPCRYPYQFPIVEFSEEIRRDVESMLAKGVSRYIIYPKNGQEFIGGVWRAGYKCLVETKNYILLEREVLASDIVNDHKI